MIMIRIENIFNSSAYNSAGSNWTNGNTHLQIYNNHQRVGRNNTKLGSDTGHDAKYA